MAPVFRLPLSHTPRVPTGPTQQAQFFWPHPSGWWLCGPTGLQLGAGCPPQRWFRCWGGGGGGGRRRRANREPSPGPSQKAHLCVFLASQQELCPTSVPARPTAPRHFLRGRPKSRGKPHSQPSWALRRKPGATVGLLGLSSEDFSDVAINSRPSKSAAVAAWRESHGRPANPVHRAPRYQPLQGGAGGGSKRLAEGTCLLASLEVGWGWLWRRKSLREEVEFLSLF